MIYWNAQSTLFEVINQCLTLLFLAVSCGYIAIPQNGSRRGEEMTYPNSVEFRCGEGFIMVGSVVRKCLANGTWDGQETICKGTLNFASLDFVLFYC